MSSHIYENNHFHLSLQSPFPGTKPVYVPRSTISGTITLKLDSDTELESIYLKIRGILHTSAKERDPFDRHGNLITGKLVHNEINLFSIVRMLHEPAIGVDFRHTEGGTGVVGRNIIGSKKIARGRCAAAPSRCAVASLLTCDDAPIRYAIPFGPITFPEAGEKGALPPSFWGLASKHKQYIFYYLKITAVRSRALSTNLR